MKNRSGSYKKVLFDPRLLEEQLPYLQKNVAALQSQSLSDAEFCVLYILLFLRIRHPKNWLQLKNKKIEEPLKTRLVLDVIPESFNLSVWEKEKLKQISFYKLFQNFNLKGIPQSINRTVLKWIEGDWKILLTTTIPTPRELLKMQVTKTRCLTIIVAPDKLHQLVLNSRDPLSFVLHDLMHADHFFHQEDIIKGQLGFYQCVDSVYDRKPIRKWMHENKTFKHEFDYVASDMNAYVVHLAKCFKSAVCKVDPDLYPAILGWWNMPAPAFSAAARLNTPEFTQQDENNLVTFFESRAL